MPRFVPNRNLDKELQRDARYLAAVAAETKKAEEQAKNFAPVRTGAYRDGIKVVIKGNQVFLSATDFKSNWIEFGSVNNIPSAPLRKGVRAAGLKFKEQGR